MRILILTNFIFIIILTDVFSQELPASSEKIADPHERINTRKTIDYRLLENLDRLMTEKKLSEFITLLTYLGSKGVKKEEGKAIFFDAVASPDDIYLLLLVKEGIVDINAIDRKGHSAIGYVFSIPENQGNERLERIKLLIELGYKIRFPEFLVACATENTVYLLSFAEESSKQQVSVNVNFGGTTPLIAAVQLGSLEMVKALISRGAEVQTKDQTGKSAIDYANEDWPKTNIPHLSLESIRERQNLIQKAVVEAAYQKRATNSKGGKRVR